jgi:maltooligosyltrehalose trehalohydrolase
VRVGAYYLGNGECEFTVWAPTLNQVALQLLSPQKRLIPLAQDSDGYWQVCAQDIYPGALYQYVLNETEAHPDPASQFQPQGVHGPSQVIDNTFEWTDQNWQGISLPSYIIYELHVGTFTAEGTFEAAITRLTDLKALGVTAIEIMPVAQFPGDSAAEPGLAYRNWGYDGVYLYAVQNSYGGPHGLKRFVDACHQQGMAVILDVVYNHFGPEGNYMSHFAPYFTETYRTPWGSAMNFDDAYSPGVRNFFIQNALHWFQDYHIDALRLDAIQAIYDLGAKHFLRELAEVVEVFSQHDGRKRYLTAESDLNNPRLVRSLERDGDGLNAQWNDDFHHALHAVLTGDRQGYYQDFGQLTQLAKTYEDSFVYDWKYSPYRKRYHGMPCRDLMPYQFIVCTQNHDQIANQKLLGERLAEILGFEGTKLAAGALLLSPGLPLLFMGEEYGETAPFTYFVSHSDPDLIEAVRKGRKLEFSGFGYHGDPPDPEATTTFLSCKLNWQLRYAGSHKILLEFYQALIQLRKTHPALLNFERSSIKAIADEALQLLTLYRSAKNCQLLSLFNFNHLEITIRPDLDDTCQVQKLLDSAEEEWLGQGTYLPQTLNPGQSVRVQRRSFAIYELTSV